MAIGLMGSLLPMAVLAEPVLPMVAGATLLESSQSAVVDQLIPLGSIKEGRDGRALPERSKRVAGQLEKLLYQLPSELNIKESRKLLDARFNALQPNDHLLYRCEGRDCGQSNLWANDVFGESLLFGNDRTQFALILVSDDLRSLTMVYGSERPNRRSHYIGQRLSLAQAWTLEQPSESRRETQRWAVNMTRTVKGKLDLKQAKVLLNPVNMELSKHPTRHWALVAYECNPMAAPDAFANSQQILDEVRPLLTSTGKEFHAISMGNVHNSPCAIGKNLEIIELQP